MFSDRFETLLFDNVKTHFNAKPMVALYNDQEVCLAPYFIIYTWYVHTTTRIISYDVIWFLVPARAYELSSAREESYTFYFQFKGLTLTVPVPDSESFVRDAKTALDSADVTSSSSDGNRGGAQAPLQISECL